LRAHLLPPACRFFRSTSFTTNKSGARFPCIKDWPNRASTDPAVVIEWFDIVFPYAFVGIELDRAGLVVVDADRHGGPDGVAALAELGDFPSHPIISTRGGGFHHYFRQSDPPVRRQIPWRPGIDLLAAGSFIVAYAPFDISKVPVLPEVFQTTPREKLPVATHNLSFSVATKEELPKPIYRKLIRVMPLSEVVCRRHHRWAGSILRRLMAHSSGRNGALVRATIEFRPIIEQELISAAAARALLVAACAVNGYLEKVRIDHVNGVISSALRPQKERGCVFVRSQRA
jgi:Bifunctional DNA primase/polymerase, N-terminal